MPKPNVRERILTAGLDTLLQRGFNATSVQDITEAAGVPKGSFYNHFESKEALGVEAVLAYVGLREAGIVALLDTSVPPLARLRNEFQGLVDTIAGNAFVYGCLLGTMGSEVSNQSSLICGTVEQMFVDWTGALALVIAEGQQLGAIPPDQPADVLAGYLLGAWQGAVLRARVAKQQEPLDQFMTITFDKVLA